LDKEDDGHAEAAVQAALGANEAQRAVQVLLENLCRGRAPADKSPSSPVDSALDLLHDHAALLKAQESLLLQSQDKLSLNVVFWAWMTAMIAVLNLFLDLELSYT
jgi:hypothetical protein